MRVVGKRKLLEIGPRGPIEEEIQASIDNARLAPRVVPKGVYKYRSHAEANAAMDRWIVDAMVERAWELGQSSEDCSEASYRFEDRRREKEAARLNDEARLARGEVKASDLQNRNGFFSVLDRFKARLVARRVHVRIDD